MQGAYLTTGANASLNTETFTKGYTIEMFFNIPLDWNENDNSWMAALSRWGEAGQAGKSGENIRNPSRRARDGGVPHSGRETEGVPMLAFALFLLVAAIVLILVGALAHGLFWLLGVGCVIFLAALAAGWLRSAFREWSRSRGRRR